MAVEVEMELPKDRALGTMNPASALGTLAHR